MKKVLVVEDSEILRSLLSLYLSLHFSHVVVVCSGEEAITRLEKEDFDLLISDFEMRTFSDFWIFERMKWLVNPPQLVVLSRNQLIQEELRKRGSKLFLGKALSFEEFIEYIQKIRGA